VRSLRAEVVATARALVSRGLVTGTSGNVSVRTPTGSLITPSGVAYDAMTPAMVVALDEAGRHDGTRKPSSERRLHVDIYRTRPEAGAVVHTHSTYATALSTTRRGIPAFHYMVAAAGGADIRCAAYATFGTAALSEAMLDALEGRRACLLANHGVVAFGPTLASALDLAAEVEELARQYAIACGFGAPVILDAEEMARVQDAFRGYGQEPAPVRRGRSPGRGP